MEVDYWSDFHMDFEMILEYGCTMYTRTVELLTSLTTLLTPRRCPQGRQQDLDTQPRRNRRRTLRRVGR